MAILAVSALLAVSEGEPREALYRGSFREFESIIVAFEDSGISQEIAERADEAKASADSSPTGFAARYHQAASQRIEELNQRPSLANDLLIDALPSAVRAKVREGFTSDTAWYVNASEFAARWLNGSQAGVTAVGTLLWFRNHPGSLASTDSAILSSELIAPIIEVGAVREPGASGARSARRRYKRASKKALKEQGLTRKKLSQLEHQAELWAAVQTSGQRLVTVVREQWICDRFGRLDPDYLSRRIRPFDRALGIVRPKGPEPEDPGSDVSTPSIRIDPTRW